MSTTDFNLPVSGVTGTAFRNNLLAVLQALASTSQSAGEPPVTYPGMLQVKTTAGITSLRVRNATDNGWVTLFPNVALEFGGLGITAAGNNTFSGSNAFNGPVSFAAVPPGIASDDELAAVAASRTTVGQVNGLISTALAGLPLIFTKQYVNSFSPSLSSVSTFNHLLAEEPKLVMVEVVFQAAILGFAAGDVVRLAEVNGGSGTGFTVRKSTTQVEVILGATGIPIVRRDNFAVASINNLSDVSFRIRAYA